MHAKKQRLCVPGLTVVKTTQEAWALILAWMERFGEGEVKTLQVSPRFINKAKNWESV